MIIEINRFDIYENITNNLSKFVEQRLVITEAGGATRYLVCKGKSSQQVEKDVFVKLTQKTHYAICIQGNSKLRPKFSNF